MLLDSHIGGLAIFGGKPTFGEPLHVGRPNQGDRQRLFARLGDMLDRNWLSNSGPLVQELEQNIARRLGVRHCILMCNATVALEITTRALDLSGEVIVPSMTFVATAHALQWQQITPVFCDVDPHTHNIDPARIEELITPRTSGIIGVHLWGRPCDVESLTEIAERRGLTLLFDAAHAFGCSHGGRMIGGFGAAEVFSFHATKFFNTLEGGGVATNDDRLADKIRLMKNFGFSGYDNVIHVGTNGKMSEASAAFGLTLLESLDEIRAVNRRNHRLYCKMLRDVPGITVVSYDERESNNYQYVVLEVDQREAGLSRDQLLAVLRAENVLARRYFYPGCHRMEPYRSHFPHAHLLLPQTERLVERVLQLPTGTSVAEEDVRTVAGIVRQAVASAAEVRRALTQTPARHLQKAA
jgi:dTDP-4-amino-4,6-dideoxygalactose transaminase